MTGRVLSVLTMCFLSMFSYAGTPAQSGKITYLVAHQAPEPPETASRTGQRFVVTLDGTMRGDNSCGADRWAGYFDTEAGKAQYSTLLAMYLSGKEVLIKGTDGSPCIGNDLYIRNVYPAY